MQRYLKTLLPILFVLLAVGCSNRRLQRSPGLERPKIHFSAAESEHVRLPGVNPLPENGLLVLPLASLQKEFCYPCDGKLISPFGPRNGSQHTGIDIKAAPNDIIRAALPGVVRMSKLYGNYGNIVVIRHYCGIETVYAHHSKNLVRVNDVVEAGEPVGLAGRTGRATTDHLHFELRAAGEPLDPTRMVDPETKRLRSDTLYIQMREGKVIAYNSAKEGKPAAKQSKTDTAQYYRVKQGDTLYSISRRYGTTVETLCRLNNISETSILRIDQRIRVK